MSDRTPLPWRLTQAEQRQLIRDALAKDPTLPDQRIARVIGCSDKTVARVRAAAGVGPYRCHRDRHLPGTPPPTKRQLRNQIAALRDELGNERSLRINAEQALAIERATPPAPLPVPPLANAPQAAEASATPPPLDSTRPPKLDLRRPYGEIWKGGSYPTLIQDGFLFSASGEYIGPQKC